jgi:P27 family predicted phage terminase small subunit
MKIQPKNIAKLSPPAFLTGRAREVWDEISPEIEALGAAKGIESQALGCLCTAIADLEAAEAAIAEHGLVAKSERGLIKNPATSIKNAALSHIYKFSAAFGLTPASRGNTLHARRLNQSS